MSESRKVFSVRELYKIADFAVEVTADSELEALQIWSGNMASHRALVVPRRVLDLQIEFELRSGWLKANDRNGVEVSVEDGRIRHAKLDTPVLTGTLTRDDEILKGRLIVNGDAPDPMDIGLRACLSFLCEERGQLIVHASAVERDGRAWVFVGPSGSGKTTIAAELNGGRTPFSLDRCILEPKEKGSFQVHSTPFSDPSRLLSRRAGTLEGVFFIAHSLEHHLVPMKPFEVVKNLLPQILAFSRDEKMVTRTIGTVGRLSESGLCKHLRFARNEAFWRQIEKDN